MPLPLIEIGIAGLVVAAWRKSKNKGVLTDERRECYEAAMAEMKDPEKLRTLAEEYEKQGLPTQAAMLRKRADLRAMPEEKKEQYKAVYEKGLASENPAAVDKLADLFEDLTASKFCNDLRKHAAELRKNAKAKAEAEAKAKHAETREAVKKARTGQATEAKPIEAKAEIVQESATVHGE